jgi:uncharacterized protein DUF669
MSEFDELPETFDPSGHEGTRDFEPFPPGWYQAQMIESSVEHARNGNGTYLLAVFEILSGDYRGRKIYQNVTLQNTSQQAVEIGQRLLADIYTAIGITTPTKDIRVMLFKPVIVRAGIKRDKDGVYPDRNCITSVRPPDYQPKRVVRNASAATVAAAAHEQPAAPATPAPSPTPSSTPKSAAARGDAPWRS